MPVTAVAPVAPRLAIATRFAACVVLLRAIAGCAVAGEPDGACGPPTGTVARVIDGDTIVVTSGVHVRYLLVDTPELSKSACFAEDAAAYNRALVAGRTVDLAYDVACSDRYGRSLAYVTADGLDINRELIARGYACVLHIPPDGDARAAEYESLAATARARHLGLWGACDPIPCR